MDIFTTAELCSFAKMEYRRGVECGITVEGEDHFRKAYTYLLNLGTIVIPYSREYTTLRPAKELIERYLCGPYTGLSPFIEALPALKVQAAWIVLREFLLGDSLPDWVTLDWLRDSFKLTIGYFNAMLMVKKADLHPQSHSFRHKMPIIEGHGSVKVYIGDLLRTYNKTPKDLEFYNQRIVEAIGDVLPCLMSSLGAENTSLLALSKKEVGGKDATLAEFMLRCDIEAGGIWERTIFILGVRHICSQCEMAYYSDPTLRGRQDTLFLCTSEDSLLSPPDKSYQQDAQEHRQRNNLSPMYISRVVQAVNTYPKSIATAKRLGLTDDALNDLLLKSEKERG